VQSISKVDDFLDPISAMTTSPNPEKPFLAHPHQARERTLAIPIDGPMQNRL
jgi:hypothetical protein